MLSHAMISQTVLSQTTTSLPRSARCQLTALRMICICACVVAIACNAHAQSHPQLVTVAGSGSPQNNGDAGVATLLGVKDTFGVEIGPQHALYIAEVGHHRIRRVDLTTNHITTVAGNGTKGYAGDGKLATEAQLNEPYEVRFDAAGNLYFVEMQNHVIRRVDATTQVITTIAGTGKAGFHGDGGPATRATFNRPHSIALDQQGNLYIADIGNHRIRRINLGTGIIETIAGNGEKELPADGQLAKQHPMLGPRALYVTGNQLWIALREGNSVWQLDLQTGRLKHIAGSGQSGSVDGGPREATFSGPKGLVVDDKENVYVVDTENHTIRRIDGQSREVTTIAGNGVAGHGVGRALSAQINRPHGICLGADGSLFVGDTLNHRVVQIRE